MSPTAHEVAFHGERGATENACQGWLDSKAEVWVSLKGRQKWEGQGVVREHLVYPSSSRVPCLCCWPSFVCVFVSGLHGDIMLKHCRAVCLRWKSKQVASHWNVFIDCMAYAIKENFPISKEDTVRDGPWMPETTSCAEIYPWYACSSPYTSMIKFTV